MSEYFFLNTIRYKTIRFAIKIKMSPDSITGYVIRFRQVRGEKREGEDREDKEDKEDREDREEDNNEITSYVTSVNPGGSAIR